MKNQLVILLIAVGLMTVGCTKETVDPVQYGSIQGQVINSNNNQGVANANVTTSPATNSILTGNDGTFRLDEVPTGSYTISASKPEVGSHSVSIQVREGRTASAEIYLGGGSASNLQAEVISWERSESNDSLFAHVEYRVQNTSSNSGIGEYEIYFGVYTDVNDYYHEVSGTELGPREQNFRNFMRYIDRGSIDSVRIHDIWTN
ncbi:MAG: carboxypeptidase-like regulatory domain-containing protein [Balneolaceae bacterium]|nr:carboxypeptidase-like regulatory domain-containing protein [Balneolaceae bacterium]